MRLPVILFILFLLLPATASGQSLVNAKAPEFSLQDQYDKAVSLRQFEGSIVVLIASDKEGRVQNPQWKKAISGKYGENVAIVGIADVRSVPFFLKGKIKSDFKKDEGSILMDWKGEVFKAYGLAPKVSNVILIDQNGYIRFVYSGDATEDARERLFREIDKIDRMSKGGVRL